MPRMTRSRPSTHTDDARPSKKEATRESRRVEEDIDELEEDQFDYEADLSIDPMNLDVEFLNHPVVFMKYCKASARANKEAKIAEERVKTLRSKLVMDAYDDPDRCLGKGIKATGQNVEAYYREHKEYQRIKKAWIDATYHADLLVNAVYAFQARKTVLENMVRLIGLEYNSTPAEPRDLPEMAAAFEKYKKETTSSRIREAINRK